MTTSPDEVKRAEAPPKEHLVRQAPFVVREEAHAAGAGLQMRGYAAVFDSPTMIDSWEGYFREQIAPGAFRKTLAERTPVLQFDHGSHPMIGSLPIGKVTRAAEDEHGVMVQAELADNWLVQPIRDAISNGSVNGMSFRFSVIREEWDMDTPDNIPLRTVTELRCEELGPVVFPAYQDTEVSVRSREVLAALEDPQVRRDVALAAFATSTDTPDETSTPAPVEDDHPGEGSVAAPPDGARDDGSTDEPSGPAHSSPIITEAERARVVARMYDEKL